MSCTTSDCSREQPAYPTSLSTSRALLDNTIDYVVSDHSPCVSQLKNLDTGDYSTAWGGISSLGLGCSLLWTESAKRGFKMEDVVRWTSERTGKMALVEGEKGGLRVGGDADFAGESNAWRSSSMGS